MYMTSFGSWILVILNCRYEELSFSPLIHCVFTVLKDNFMMENAFILHKTFWRYRFSSQIVHHLKICFDIHLSVPGPKCLWVLTMLLAAITTGLYEKRRKVLRTVHYIFVKFHSTTLKGLIREMLWITCLQVALYCSNFQICYWNTS